MRDAIYECEQWVPQKLETVFDFFAEAKNLESITPPHLNFHITKMSTAQIMKGTLIDYKLRLYGFSFKWKTNIREFEINKMFVDEQLKGPYKQWYHTHTFEEQDNGTLIKDHISYIIPFGFLGSLLLGKFIRNDIKKIFNYRKMIIEKNFSKQ